MSKQTPLVLSFHHINSSHGTSFEGSYPEDNLSRLANSPDAGDIIYTFDDALKCQFDAAFNCLLDHRERVYFFITTSHLENKIPQHLILRYVRETLNLCGINFYDEFFKEIELLLGINTKNLESIYPVNFLSSYKFYTPSCRAYRYLRDYVLDKEVFMRLHLELLRKASSKSLETLIGEIMMSADQIKTLAQYFKIGLHSHSHPTNIDMLDHSLVLNEYKTNHDYIIGLTGLPPTSAAFPCGRYNLAAIEVLESLGIQDVYLSSPSESYMQGNLTIHGRLDCNLYAL